jgi:4-hydroxyphenylacetate 3-monooxygenase
MKPEDVIADPKLLFTGGEYMQCLRDDREIYIDDERVMDSTARVAVLYPSSVRRAARPEASRRAALSGRYRLLRLHVPLLRVRRSRENLRGAQLPIASWSRMGRTQDF